MFPLRAQEGGVLVRAGQTEASVDLARMAGLTPAGIVCEIMNADGTMARMPQLEVIADELAMGIVAVADIIAYRLEHERLVERVAEARLPTKYGAARAIAYRSDVDPAEHVALVFGNIRTRQPVPRPRPQRVPHRRRVRQHAVRLRHAARYGHQGHRRGGARRLPLHAAGGARHRPPQQDPRLRPPGRRRRHRRGQPAPRIPARPPPLRRRRPDPRRPSASAICA